MMGNISVLSTVRGNTHEGKYTSIIHSAREYEELLELQPECLFTHQVTPSSIIGSITTERHSNHYNTDTVTATVQIQ